MFGLVNLALSSSFVIFLKDIVPAVDPSETIFPLFLINGNNFSESSIVP